MIHDDTSVQSLLALPDQDFVIACYREILQREPDPEGLAHFLGRVLAGQEKLDVAATIASSEEARKLPLEKKALIVGILSTHAKAMVTAAWSKRKRLQASEAVDHYLFVISGPQAADTGVPADTRDNDPFSDYLTSVIESTN